MWMRKGQGGPGGDNPENFCLQIEATPPVHLPTQVGPHPAQGVPAALVCSPHGLGGEGGVLRMESSLFCAVDLSGRSGLPSRQDTTLPFPGPFLAMSSLWGVLGDRRRPNPEPTMGSGAGTFKPREGECVGAHSLSRQVSDSSSLPRPLTLR